MNEIIVYFLAGAFVLTMIVLVFVLILNQKNVQYLSDRILARSLGEAKMLDKQAKETGLDIMFPMDDETLAMAEENKKKERIVRLRKEQEVLDKQMAKLKKKFG